MHPGEMGPGWIAQFGCDVAGGSLPRAPYPVPGHASVAAWAEALADRLTAVMFKLSHDLVSYAQDMTSRRLEGRPYAQPSGLPPGPGGARIPACPTTPTIPPPPLWTMCS